MRKQVFGRQLQRDINERKALFKSLVSALVLNERITTTEAKAKAVKGQIEKMVTKARKNTDEARRMLQGYFTQPVLEKFLEDVTPRFSKRPGGYTRIIKANNRFGDNAKVVVLEWVEMPVKADATASQTTPKKTASTAKAEKVEATAKTSLKKEKAKTEKKKTTKKTK